MITETGPEAASIQKALVDLGEHFDNVLILVNRVTDPVPGTSPTIETVVGERGNILSLVAQAGLYSEARSGALIPGASQ